MINPANTMFNVYNAPDTKIEHVNRLLSQENRTNQRITTFRYKPQAVTFGKVFAIGVVGGVGAIALAVGILFLNAYHLKTLGLYVTCTSSIILAADVLAIALLVRQHYKNLNFLHSVIHQPCENGTNVLNTGFRESENTIWNQKLYEVVTRHSGLGEENELSFTSVHEVEGSRDSNGNGATLRRYQVTLSQGVLTISL